MGEKKDVQNYFHFLRDERGAHSKFFVEGQSRLKEVKEVYMTVNNENTFRGMHRQKNTCKLLKVASGSFIVFMITERDMFPEMRKLDENIWYRIYSPEKDQIFVTENDYVGYLSLEDESVMLYMTDKEYIPKDDEACFPTAIQKFLLDYQFLISERDLKEI